MAAVPAAVAATIPLMPTTQTTIHTDTLPGGATLVAEPIDTMRSLSMTMLIPAGLVYEPADRLGACGVLAELMCRGAAGRSARDHSDALDRLGVHRSTHPGGRHLQLSATLVGDKLDDALPLLLDMARRPNLDADAFEPARDLALQSLDALEDEPQQKAMVNLTRRHFPRPFDRVATGVREHLDALTVDEVRAMWKRCFVPGGTILAFAGALDVERLKSRLEDLLGEWTGHVDEPRPEAEAERGYTHETASTTQTHLAVAYDTVPEPDPGSVLQKTAVAVLSGGMSGRLFTEVREKRGLCYAVMARYGGQRDRGVVTAYAGTTTARAQETLDVLIHELNRLGDGVDEDEFERARVGMKSRLVMQGESSGARAASIASDQYNLGRPRTLTELADAVDAVALDDLVAFADAHRPERMTVSTIGEQPLELK